ncbi:MAG: 1-acyl-sn-glycerol-3-phosphate acyltransferase, partial [Clostridia bacterium]|nr:1-acyl-sn-glycerol-3-phosphate acyltransferase [Clostridia bacterium]
MKKVVYYTDESEDFAGTKITQKSLPHDHKYFHGVFWRVVAWFLYYLIAVPVAFVIKRFWYREKVVGKEKLKPYKKQGFFLYGNHTRLMGDVFCPPITCFPKRVYVLANPDSVSIPVLGNFPEMLGCVPLPTDRGGMRNFHNAVLKHAEKKHVISVYPEAKIWPYYTKIRPFPSGAFRYPAESGKAAFSMTVT